MSQCRRECESCEGIVEGIARALRDIGIELRTSSPYRVCPCGVVILLLDLGQSVPALLLHLLAPTLDALTHVVGCVLALRVEEELGGGGDCAQAPSGGAVGTGLRGQARGRFKRVCVCARVRESVLVARVRVCF